MPLLTYNLDIPFPGFVDIYIAGMKMRFSKQSILTAITNVQRDRDKFATEDAYKSTLEIYEQALRLLEAEEGHNGEAQP